MASFVTALLFVFPLLLHVYLKKVKSHTLAVWGRRAGATCGEQGRHAESRGDTRGAGATRGEQGRDAGRGGEEGGSGGTPGD